MELQSVISANHHDHVLRLTPLPSTFPYCPSNFSSPDRHPGCVTFGRNILQQPVGPHPHNSPAISHCWSIITHCWMTFYRRYSSNNLFTHAGLGVPGCTGDGGCGEGASGTHAAHLTPFSRPRAAHKSGCHQAAAGLQMKLQHDSWRVLWYGCYV